MEKHTFDFLFTVETDDAENVSGAALRSALLNRLNSMSDDEMVEACEWIEQQD